MSLGLVGYKRGMSRVFTAEGESLPVTVVEVLPNRVTQVKRVAGDGYHAAQVTWGSRRADRIRRPRAGIYAKAEVGPGDGLLEFRLSEGEVAAAKLAPGRELNVSLFSKDQMVDVTGISIGKGFAGVIKRHHFSSGNASHGASLSHRSAGSIGHCQDPGRVFKGKRMAGRLGGARRTQQNLRVVRVDVERNLLLIRGSVPGCHNSRLVIRPAVKAPRPSAPTGT